MPRIQPVRPLPAASWSRVLVATLLGLWTGSVLAAPGGDGLLVKEFTCPLGGEKFKQDVGYNTSNLVHFPDGSWLGDHGIDVQIPECPGNGLVLIPDFDTPDEAFPVPYRTYTPEQLALLPALIEGEAYRALRGKSRHERALWLATQLGLSATTRLQLLQRGSWAAIEPAERKRWVERIAAEAPALIDAIAAPEAQKALPRYRVVNALRELGRFEEADARLDALEATLPDAGDHGSRSAITEMRDAIGFRDDDRYPVGLASDKWVSRVCRGGPQPPPYGPMTANARAACERLRQQSQAMRESFDEATRLQHDPVALADRCDTTPPEKRPPGLARACDEAQRERDRKAGEDLVEQQPAQVAARCEATAEADQDGPLQYACLSFGTALEMELGKLLADDDIAHDLICQGGRQPPDRAGYAHLACTHADYGREDRRVARWLADPVVLDAKCAKANRAREPGLGDACREREDQLLDLEAERLVRDPAAHSAKCAEYISTDGNPRNMAFEVHMLCSKAKLAQMRARDAPAAAAASAHAVRTVAEPHAALFQAAREVAQRVIAKAKADGTYPRKRPGDR